MPQTLVFTLLFLALLLPALGAGVLRLLAPRLGPRGMAAGAVVVFGLALVGALGLALGDVGALRLGSYTLLLPDLSGVQVDVPPVEPLPPSDNPLAEPTVTARTTPTPTTTPARSATPTTAATATPEPSPTVAPSPTATSTPTTPPAPTAPAAARTYTVESGDTLRSIAEQFDVTIQAIIDANGLTAAEADNLRVGQELIIP